MVSNLQNLVTSWLHSTRSRDWGEILEVELTGLADG